MRTKNWRKRFNNGQSSWAAVEESIHLIENICSWWTYSVGILIHLLINLLHKNLRIRWWKTLKDSGSRGQEEKNEVKAAAKSVKKLWENRKFDERVKTVWAAKMRSMWTFNDRCEGFTRSTSLEQNKGRESPDRQAQNDTSKGYRKTGGKECIGSGKGGGNKNRKVAIEGG